MQEFFYKTYGPKQKIPENIQKNLILPTQTHSNRIVEITESRTPLPLGEVGRGVDGLYYKSSLPSGGTEGGDLPYLGIKTADCAPIIFYGKIYRDPPPRQGELEGVEIIKGGFIYAAVHAGWRGLCNGIIEKTLEIFQENCGNNFNIYVGPILPEFEIQKDYCYKEISRKFGEKFFQKISEKNPVHTENPCNSSSDKKQPEKYLFNFRSALKSILPQNTEFDPRSTLKEKSLASWRENKTSDRNITIIGLSPSFLKRG